MKDFPVELMYVLMFVVIVLFQYVMKRFGPPEQADGLPDEAFPETPPVVREVPSAPALCGAAAGDFGQFGRFEASGAAPTPARLRHRFDRRSLMGTRHAVQNAVVIATILGPCRAFEPHDGR